MEKVASQWSTLSSGPLAGLESLEKAETGEKVVSQWSTLLSGPLAGLESLEKAETGEKAVSQWSTLSSGPLARVARPENGGNWGKSHELVVHSVEWTTS